LRLDPDRLLDHLAPVIETVSRVRSALPIDKTLIGFCGGPWTVATYMIGGRGSPDQAAARLFALQQPEAFATLIDILVEASARYLLAQVSAGAEVVQIFESWAGNLDEAQFRERVIEPNRRIVRLVRQQAPASTIVTGFPRGAGPLLSAYAEGTGIDCVGLDHTMPPYHADAVLPKSLAVQGNLDPVRLLAGGGQMDEAARGIITAFQNRPHVFNLGHGITPDTPIENVERLIKVVREGS
jgi:uroporphyrinogen decarboxylase